MKTPCNYKEMGAPRKMHIMVNIRAHMLACQRRIRTRGPQVRSPDPQVGRTWPDPRPGAH
jgi:hypothetical protein